jgi:hypothetical protein
MIAYNITKEMKAVELESLLQQANKTQEHQSKKICSKDILEENFNRNLENNSTTCIESYGIIGLHCCGDLSSSMCRLFVTAKYCKCLCFVGCCYNLLTTREDKNMPNYGYPLNSHISISMSHYARNAIVQVYKLNDYDR